MPRFYFFKSSIQDDSMSGISIFTTSAKKAFAYARKHFIKHHCKGVPVLMSV